MLVYGTSLCHCNIALDKADVPKLKKVLQSSDGDWDPDMQLWIDKFLKSLDDRIK